MDEFPSQLSLHCECLQPLLKCYLEVGLPPSLLLDCLSHKDFSLHPPQILVQVPPTPLPPSIPWLCFPTGISANAECVDRDNAVFGFCVEGENGEELYGVVMRFYDRYEEGVGGWDEKQVTRNRMVGGGRTERASLLGDAPKTEDTMSFLRNLELPRLRKNTSIPHTSHSEFQLPSRWTLPPDTRSRTSTHIDFRPPPQAVMVPRCFLFLSPFPLLETIKKLVWTLYNTVKSGSFYPLECYVLHLLLTIPAPTSQTQSIYTLHDTVFPISVPPSNRLPVFDVNLGTLFHCLSLEHVLTVLKCVLMERSVIFVSKYEERASDCAFSVKGLIYPMKWEMGFVPVLPKLWVDYVWAPTRFIVGVREEDKHDVQSRCTGTEVIVDLDSDTITIGCSQWLTHPPPLSDTAELPDHYGKKLQKKVAAILRDVPGCSLKTVKLGQPWLEVEDIARIRDCFFQFFVSVLRQYRIYLRVNNGEFSFDKSGFLGSSADFSGDFMREFVESRMFASFLAGKAAPNSTEQSCENRFFDEHIIAKQNRSKLSSKVKTPFITDKTTDEKTEIPIPKMQIYFRKIPEFEKYAKFPSFSYVFAGKIDLPLLISVQKPKIHPKISTKSDFLHLHTGPNGVDLLFAAWIRIWSHSLFCQNSGEFVFRANELKKVLGIMREKRVFLCDGCRNTVIESCLRVNSGLAMPIFIDFDGKKEKKGSEIMKLFEKTVFSCQKAGKEPINTKEEPVLRGFSRKNEGFISDSRVISFFLKGFCSNCKVNSTVTELMQAIMRENTVEIACPACKTPINPVLSVQIGTKTPQIAEIPPQNPVFEAIFLLSPYQTLTQIDNLPSDFDLYSVRDRETGLFWSLIWYFQYFSLPYEFLVPYDREERRGLAEVEEESPKTAVVAFTSEGFEGVLRGVGKNGESQTEISLIVPSNSLCP